MPPSPQRGKLTHTLPAKSAEQRLDIVGNIG